MCAPALWDISLANFASYDTVQTRYVISVQREEALEQSLLVKRHTVNLGLKHHGGKEEPVWMTLHPLQSRRRTSLDDTPSLQRRRTNLDDTPSYQEEKKNQSGWHSIPPLREEEPVWMTLHPPLREEEPVWMTIHPPAREKNQSGWHFIPLSEKKSLDDTSIPLSEKKNQSGWHSIPLSEKNHSGWHSIPVLLPENLRAHLQLSV